MSQENESAEVDVLEQEGDTSMEEVGSDTGSESQGEETITIPKSKFNSIRRKAAAYDADKDKPKPITKTSSDEKWKQKIELKVEGYNEEEVDFIMKNGGKDALKSGFVSSAITAMREQKKAEAAVVATEGEKSSSGKGFSQEDFAKLSAEEQLKHLSGLK